MARPLTGAYSRVRCAPGSSGRITVSDVISVLLSGQVGEVWVLEHDRTGLEQGLQVGQDLGPAAGDGRNQFGRIAFDRMGDGELDRGAVLLEFDRAERVA